LSRFEASPGAWQPEGLLAELRGSDLDPQGRLLSFSVCGGTLFGRVATSDLLGPPRVGHSSDRRCPGTGENHFVGRGDQSGSRCRRPVPLFVKTATLCDPIGELKSGATIRIQGGSVAGMVLVDVPGGPVLPLDDAHFAVRAADAPSCE
jgi:hypothetical protein